MTKSVALIVQSGGPTAVINQSLVGLIDSLVANRFEKIWGANDSINGVLSRDFYDLSSLSEKELRGYELAPGSMLGSKKHMPTLDELHGIISTFQRFDVRYFFSIGGNDTAKVSSGIAEIAKERNHEVQVIHIPKTIDNDLLCTDYSPGYPSAAMFVAQAVHNLGHDLKSTKGVKIDIVMGRDVGWLAAASVALKCDELDSPHLVYLPEERFTLDDFREDVARVYDKNNGICHVVVAEGVLKQLEGVIFLDYDTQGNPRLSDGMLGRILANSLIKSGFSSVRHDTFGRLQRCYERSVIDSYNATLVGTAAANYAVQGKSGIMVGLTRGPNDVFCLRPVELDDVVGKIRVFPAEYIKDGRQVSPLFLDYLNPLLGNLKYNFGFECKKVDLEALK